MDGLVSQAAGGEALEGSRWLLRGGQRGRGGVPGERAHTSRQEGVELPQAAVLQHVVGPAPA